MVLLKPLSLWICYVATENEYNEVWERFPPLPEGVIKMQLLMALYERESRSPTWPPTATCGRDTVLTLQESDWSFHPWLQADVTL